MLKGCPRLGAMMPSGRQTTSNYHTQYPAIDAPISDDALGAALGYARGCARGSVKKLARAVITVHIIMAALVCSAALCVHIGKAIQHTGGRTQCVSICAQTGLE